MERGAGRTVSNAAVKFLNLGVRIVAWTRYCERQKAIPAAPGELIVSLTFHDTPRRSRLVFVAFWVLFFSLCLFWCRSSTAHAHINKALLWWLSERTPATAVAVWGQRNYCATFKKTHTKSLGGVWLTVCSLWFPGKPYERLNNGTLTHWNTPKSCSNN